MGNSGGLGNGGGKHDGHPKDEPCLTSRDRGPSPHPTSGGASPVWADLQHPPPDVQKTTREDSYVRISFLWTEGERDYAGLTIGAKDFNGKVFVEYSLSGEAAPPLRKEISAILSEAKSGKYPPLELALTFHFLTLHNTSLTWTASRVNSPNVDEDNAPPMTRAVVPFHQFMTERDDSLHTYYCSQQVGHQVMKLEVKLSLVLGIARFNLSSFDPTDQRLIQRYFSVQNMGKGGRAAVNDPVYRDLMVTAWEAMDLFWSKSPIAASRYLKKQEALSEERLAQLEIDNETKQNDESAREADKRIAALEYQLEDCDVIRSLTCGAEIIFAVGRSRALLQIRAQSNEDASHFEWTFRDAGDLSDEKNATRMAILDAIELLASTESEVLQYQAVEKLHSIQGSFQSDSGSLEDVIHSEMVEELERIPGLKIHLVAPRTTHEIVRVVNGIETIRLAVRDSGILAEQLDLFGQVEVEVLPDRSLNVVCTNSLHGHAWAHLSAESRDGFGGILEILIGLANTVVDQEWKGPESLMQLLSDVVECDPQGSFLLTSGDPLTEAVPPLHDAEGQRMYAVAASIVRQYVSLANCKQEDCRVVWCKRGAVELLLGAESAPFSMLMAIRNFSLTDVHIIPKGSLDAYSSGPDLSKAIRFQGELPLLAGIEHRAGINSDLLSSVIHSFAVLTLEGVFGRSDNSTESFDRSTLREVLEHLFIRVE